VIEAVQRYLELRKALGYRDLDISRDLPAFARFAARRGAAHLRDVDAIAWVSQGGAHSRRYELLASIRRLGLYLHAEDERHEVLAEEHTRSFRRTKRPPPYIYTDTEIRQILQELGELNLVHAYDAATYKHIVGLIAATGLRISEARSIVHLHKSTSTALKSYLLDRPKSLSQDRLFVIHNNRTPSGHSIGTMFRRCTNRLNLTGRNGSGLPRIHDLRHTFAVRSLAACGSDRKTISNHMVALSTYMGHVSVASTYWYLEISTETKESMALAIEEVLNA
jgi:integrase/recombinase XerD